jgi:pyrimidine-nucleoside phosphorylase
VDVRSVLRTKRDGGELGEDEVRFVLRGIVDGDVPDYQAAALLASIFFNGMTDAELERWTRAMLESGTTLDFTNLPQKKVDKHSTGGVGDKVSIPLAPAVAACGLAVPMISGRGLGHTGGTLDKLESIPGFTTRLDEAAIKRAVDRTGVAFGAQTQDLVPADRILYALRDATELVESLPLIASSIMSKKLAEGLDALVLDIKYGSGAFLSDPARGAELGRTMLRLADGMGLSAAAWQTAMDRPLGAAVGHALEIAESIDCLAGEGPDDLRELVCLFGGQMLELAGSAATPEEGRERIAEALDQGRALGVLELVVTEQGGDPRCLADRTLLPHTDSVDPFTAAASGTLAFADVREVGRAVVALGGGRSSVEDEIDPAVGLVWRKRAGETVQRGDVLCEVHHRDGHGLDEARAHLARALAFDATAAAPGPLVLARVEP